MTKTNPAFGYGKETAYKTCQAFANTNGSTKLRLLRNVSEDLNTNIQRDESNEVRGDSQSSGSTITGANAGGSIQLQYSLDTFDDLLVGLLYAATVNDAGTGREDGWQQGGFTPVADIMAGAGSITFDFAANKLTSSSLFTPPAAGTRIYVTGFGNRNLDTIFIVGSGTNDASNITLVNDTGEASIAAYAGIAANVTTTTGLVRPVKGYTRNGTFERSFQMVRLYSDVELAGTASTTGLTAVDWTVFRGSIPTSIQLACAPGQAGWTGTMSVLCADEQIVEDATATAVGGFTIGNWDQILVSNTNPLANAIQSVVMVRLRKDNGAQTTAKRFDPLSFNINVANNASEIAATRNLGAVAINRGTFTVTVAMSLLYVDPTFHKAMLADSFYEVEIGVADSEGRCQLWRFPKARFTSERPSPGKNQPIAQNLSFLCEAGGPGGVSSSSAGTGRMVEILSFYTRAA